LHLRSIRIRSIVAGALSVLAAPALSRSQARAGENTVGFEYRAPPDCPRGSEFAALVAGRTAGSWRLLESSPEPRLSVEIVPDASGKTGRLRLTGKGDRPTLPREVTAPDCGDIVRALALTAALSLEEETARAVEPPAALHAEAPPGAPSRFALGIALTAAAILPPYPMAGVGLFVERGDLAWPAGRILHRPDVRLAITHVRNDLPGETGKARFNLTTGALLVCPLGWSALRACAAAEAGLLDGRGQEVASPLTDRSLWIAAGGLLRAHATLGGGGFIEAAFGLWAPLRRASFIFEMPTVPVAKVPAVIATGGVSAGLTIP
jgi:hypothetical protein